MTKEQLEQRLQQLSTQRAQALGTVHAVEGAIQEVRSWLEKLAAEDDSDAEE